MQQKKYSKLADNSLIGYGYNNNTVLPFFIRWKQI